MSDGSLEVEDLHVWRGERHVLRGVRVALAAGQCLKLTGANGSGKTTLLRTIAALSWPEEGEVRWRGVSVRRDLRAFHADMAYLGHEPPLKADLSAHENLRYWVGSRRRCGAGAIEGALRRVGAEGCAAQLVRTLSAGQRRRVALAGLSLLAVPLWLLDEPTTNLDADGQALVGGMLGEHLGQGGIAIAAVHHPLPGALTGVQTLELAA
ncbi:MAG: heme ABC exporter ATP-binding protein CcmA [Gammaproteobacteria bacterium]|nr:heme ABC exporter ATP-binding protein CcmA [Gammaproteobacteria bacterium]MBV9696220.1 heme ABC exporter ATP-binding protein CcmA [Gammaproteobacteria bacterium]